MCLPDAELSERVSCYFQAFFAVALSRPDIIDAYWTCNPCKISPLNPLSTEAPFGPDMEHYEDAHNASSRSVEEMQQLKKQLSSELPGHIVPLTTALLTQRQSYNPGEYKYVVVLTGVVCVCSCMP